MNSVRCRLVRKGVLMWLGSRLLPATSASIGVKSRAFVSLTSVTETEGSVRSCSSKHSAVRMPPNPPPTMTIRFVTDGADNRDTGSAPSTRSAMSFKPWVIRPSRAPYCTQPTRAGKCARICSALHSGIWPEAKGNAITLTKPQSGTPSAPAPWVGRNVTA